jgi:transcriptional regulator with XRE-family HTH domain
MSSKKIGFMEKNFGKRVRQIRKERRLTQKEFAEPIEISHKYVSDIEKGKIVPSRAVIKLMELTYGLNHDWLLEGDGKKYLDPDFSEKKSVEPALAPNQMTLDAESWDLLRQVYEIISSDTVFKTALIGNIRAFHKALETENRFDDNDQRVTDLEQQMQIIIDQNSRLQTTVQKLDRRSGQRRVAETAPPDDVERRSKKERRRALGR